MNICSKTKIENAFCMYLKFKSMNVNIRKNV